MSSARLPASGSAPERVFRVSDEHVGPEFNVYWKYAWDEM
jgi:hypothetical protein